MPFIAILTTDQPDEIRIVVASAPLDPGHHPGPDGRFVEDPIAVLFQREVPEGEVLRLRLEQLLASSRVAGTEDRYACPVPIAVRAIEVAAAELWPTRRLRCTDCGQYFAVPYPERHRMYLACPHCHNPLLNPGWAAG